MPQHAADHQSPAISRLLLDVAEGRLDERGLSVVEAWLTAEAPAPPRKLVDAAVRIFPDVYATA